MKSLIFISMTLLMSVAAEARLYISCDGRLKSPDTKNPNLAITENISFRAVGGGAWPFDLERSIELHSNPNTTVLGKGQYVLFGGETNIPANATAQSVIGKNIELFATGRVDFAPNYGPFRFPSGQKIRVGTLRMLTLQVGILQTLDRQDIGLSCLLNDAN